MLYYDGIGTSKGIDPTKSDRSKSCMICHYWFFNHELKFQDSVCSGCHDLTMLYVHISNIAITTVKNVDYCCIHNSKFEAISLLKNSLLEERGYIYKILSLIPIYSRQFFFYFFCFAIYKMVDNEYSTNIRKSLNISIGTVMTNPEMVKFVPDHLKTYKMCKHAVRKSPFLIRYIPDQH